MIVFSAFTLLIILTLTNSRQRRQIQAKSWQDWVLDGLGLLCQGLGIPILQLFLILTLYPHLLPGLEHSGSLPAIPAFLLSFVGVDYLYYWNHRLLHTSGLWPIHQVHHTVTTMDVLGTSRNTLWSSFFILYLWIHGLFIYLLADPTSYLIGVSLTAALDLWRHSSWQPCEQSGFYRVLSPWLILPQDHACHHTAEGIETLFGANFKVWDYLHGTYAFHSNSRPKCLGVATVLPLWKQLLWPFT